MSYLELLVTGYRAGLTCCRPRELETLRAELAAATDPADRGHALGEIAAALARERSPAANDASVLQ